MFTHVKSVRVAVALGAAAVAAVGSLGVGSAVCEAAPVAFPVGQGGNGNTYEVVIDQVEGGRAIRAWVMNCNVMPITDRIRLETAVMQAQALPYAGFEPVFQTHLKLAF